MVANLELAAPDLTACDLEPIRIPGSIQPHGVLLALSPDGLEVVQASANASLLLGRSVERVLGARLEELLPCAGTEAWGELSRRTPEQGALQLRRPPSPDGTVPALTAVVHRADGLLILELEEVAGPEGDLYDALQPLVSGFALELQAASSVEDLGTLAARQVRAITGFDRVLVYRFDERWNGTVIAEDRNEALPSYLDLRFPASDIPAQARELYRLNRLRLIPDASYEPVPLVPARNPLTGRPPDLGFAVLRSVSPVHLEYMRNMGTAASMSVSLLHDGELWGLIACHNKEPRRLPLHVRTACDLLGQIVSLQITAKEHALETGRRMELKRVESRLLARMAAAERFTDGLADHPEDLLRLADARGAAILHEGRCRLVGETPPEDVVRRIAEWLSGSAAETFRTESLARDMPGAEAWKDTASGLLAASISEIHPSYVLWFRPEVVRTVSWGGDPRKPVEPAASGPRLHPRRSFEQWKETVRLRSLPWRPSEVEAARELRGAIVGIVLRRAEELASLTDELRRSNKELEAFSYSVSHDLRAPFRHIVGYAELLREHEGERLTERGRRFVATIIESAFSAGKLIDDLLSFSHMGRARLQPVRIDMRALVDEVRRQLDPQAAGRRLSWRIGDLSPAHGDPVMLRLALVNLLSNALKYTRPREEAVITIESRDGAGETVYTVRDNGVGFDMAYANKLFGVFQRLHRMEEFEGTGIGLANVRRIVERHGGRVWAEGEVDRGAAFHVALPRPDAEA